MEYRDAGLLLLGIAGVYVAHKAATRPPKEIHLVRESSLERFESSLAVAEKKLQAALWSGDADCIKAARAARNAILGVPADTL